MNVISYQPELHRCQLELWWQQWNIPAFSLELLSNTGLIIPEKACMFMYETNSPIIMFENLVANKELTTQERDIAVRNLVARGKEYAKSKGYKQIVLTTNNESILRRAAEDDCFISPDKYFFMFKEVN